MMMVIKNSSTSVIMNNYRLLITFLAFNCSLTICCLLLFISACPKSGEAAPQSAAISNNEQLLQSQQDGAQQELDQINNRIEQTKSSTNNTNDHIVGGFKLSKLFDFSEYKRIYRKNYKNAVQEMARMKLYLGGVLRVIIAAIKHRFFGKKYYLAVNRMTDWTDDEWHQVSVDPSLIRGDKSSLDSKGDDVKSPNEDESSTKHFDTAELSDIDTMIPEMFNSETFQKFVDEISGGNQTNVIQTDVVGDNDNDDDITTSDNKLNARMLFRSPQQQSQQQDEIYESATYSSIPKSNNPRYEQPQVMSQADTSEPTERELKKSDTEEIVKQETPQAKAANAPNGILDIFLSGLSFLITLGGRQNDNDSGEKKFEIYSDGPDKIFVDHRKTGCLRPPSHQMECGSCYAFASLALYEYLFCMSQRPRFGKRNQPVKFSPQYLIDCAPSRDPYLKGCKGGNPIKVAEFVNQYGLELEVNYPYAAERQLCPYSDDDDPKTMGYIRVNEPGLELLKPVDFDDMLRKKPILINIYPNSELKSYGGGIYDNYACEYKYAHAMMLVGRGRKDKQEYYIIRNSLGSEWGEGGYLYISKGAALNCLVDDAGTTSHAKFPSAQVNPRYNKKDMKTLLPFREVNQIESENHESYPSSSSSSSS